MNRVLRRVIDLDRGESPDADVQRDPRGVDSACRETIEQFGVKCSPAVGAATDPTRSA